MSDMRVRKGRPISLLLIGSAGVLALVPTSQRVVERFYSQQVYLVAQNLLTPFSSLMPVALFDVLLLGAIIVMPWAWFRAIHRAGPGERWCTIRQMAITTVTAGALAYLVFFFVWGLNYRREPLTTKLDYESKRIHNEALEILANEVTANLNRLYPQAHAQRWWTLDELPARLGPAFQRVQRDLGVQRTAVPGLPKPTLLTPYFQWAGINGMVSPFSLEVLVNTTVLPFERPFVVAHEWAHLAGYANESEASFVGWLTCLSGDVGARYSAWIFLFPHLVRQFDPDQQGRLWQRMDDGPMSDFRLVSARVSQAVPGVRTNANRVYDRYLRANRVTDGIASYGAVVDLVLGSTIGERAVRQAKQTS
jgi:hypothetical protein